VTVTGLLQTPNCSNMDILRHELGQTIEMCLRNQVLLVNHCLFDNVVGHFYTKP